MNLNDLKVIVHEGDVCDVVKWIKDKIGKHEVLSLREYFNGQDVYGVYLEGDEKFRYYYECVGRGHYTVFVIND